MLSEYDAIFEAAKSSISQYIPNVSRTALRGMVLFLVPHK